MKVVLAAFIAVAGAVPAHAILVDITQPNTRLSAVLGNQFLVGDKLFTVPANAFQSVTFTANDVFISPVINADVLTGQGFRLTGAWNDAPGNGAVDFVFAYDVEITPEFIAQGYRIHDATLRFNGNATSTGSYARVDETIMDLNNNVLAQAAVYSFGNGGPTRLQDNSTFANLTRLRLVKDVQFFANGSKGTATASFVDQTFSQVIVPLPSAAGLAIAGLGLTAVRRRR